MSSTDFVVTHNHAVGMGYCNRGLRVWFIRHNMDFNTFRKQGYLASELIKTGDSMALKLVEFAKNGKL